MGICFWTLNGRFVCVFFSQALVRHCGRDNARQPALHLVRLASTTIIIFLNARLKFNRFLKAHCQLMWKESCYVARESAEFLKAANSPEAVDIPVFLRKVKISSSFKINSVS